MAAARAEQAAEVDPVQRRRQQPEDREGAVAAADVRSAPPRWRGTLRRGRGRPATVPGSVIAMKSSAGAMRAHGGVKGVRLGGRAGLAADAEDGPRRLAPTRGSPAPRRGGSSRGCAAPGRRRRAPSAEDAAEELRGEARAAHARAPRRGCSRRRGPRGRCARAHRSAPASRPAGPASRARRRPPPERLPDAAHRLPSRRPQPLGDALIGPGARRAAHGGCQRVGAGRAVTPERAPCAGRR